MQTRFLWCCLGALLAVLGTAGCERQQKASKDLQVRAEKAELELAVATQALDKVKLERDEFQRLLNERTEQLNKIKAELQTSQDRSEKQGQQLEQYNRDRDKAGTAAKDAARTNEGLQVQLREKTLQIQNLEREKKDLQQTVQELTAQVQVLVQSLTNGGGGNDANGM
jgi:chromosome segregation ATPase